MQIRDGRELLLLQSLDLLLSFMNVLLVYFLCCSVSLSQYEPAQEGFHQRDDRRLVLWS